MRQWMMVATAGVGLMAADVQAATISFGLPLYTGSGQTPAVTGTNWASSRFTATKSFPVDRLHIYVGGVSANAEDMPVELWSDNGGLPGTLIAAGTIAEPAAGYNAAAIPLTNLTAGTVYHVIQKGPAVGTASARQLTGSNAAYSSFAAVADANMARLSTTNSGSTWASGGGTTGFTVGVSNSSTHDADGQAYSGTTSAGPLGTNGAFIGGTQWRGQQFVYDEPDGTLQAVSFRVAVGGTKPTDDLYLHLLDDQNNELYSGVLLDNDQAALSSTSIHTLTVAGSAPTLNEGKTYRLVLSSPGSTAGAYSLYANVIDSASTQPAGDLLKLSFQGSSGFYIQGTSSSGLPTSWTNRDSAVDAADATFGLTVSIPEPGAMGLMGLGGLAMMKRWRSPSSR